MSDRPNIDLHTHSTCSDGALTPHQLIAHAAAAGVEVLALTDHDTVAGLEEAGRAARHCGITLVPGVEISASWRAQVIHVLGWWLDPASAALAAMLQAQAGRRRERMRKMCARLERLGLPGDELLLAVHGRPGVPTRTHLADALVAGGHARDTDQAFRKYLGAGKSAHVAPDWPALEVVIASICAAGGVAGLAHPARYALSAGAKRRLLTDFAAAGGTAIEVLSGANGASHVEGNAQLALKYGLSGSVGSDFHNPQLAWNPLGRSLKLPDCVTPVWRGYIT